jgi:hypothetical protein
VQYRQQLIQQQRQAEWRERQLQQQRRMAQYRYQQRYLENLRQQQIRLQQARYYDYNNDPYYYTAPSYRYYRSGRYYQVNQYAASQLRQAVNDGYEQGFYAGQADREDGWRNGSYRDSYAYQDASYGYNGYYVNQDEYQYYFRQGFQRGYEDGFNSRYQYGNYSNGKYAILATVLSQVLNLQNLF